MTANKLQIAAHNDIFRPQIAAAPSLTATDHKNEWTVAAICSRVVAALGCASRVSCRTRPSFWRRSPCFPPDNSAAIGRSAYRFDPSA